MPETNGEIPLTGDPRVDAALERIRGKFQDLEDAMLVQVALEKKMSERVKEQQNCSCALRPIWPKSPAS